MMRVVFQPMRLIDKKSGKLIAGSAGRAVLQTIYPQHPDYNGAREELIDHNGAAYDDKTRAKLRAEPAGHPLESFLPFNW